MFRLSSTQRFAGIVLAWYALVVALASASPWLASQRMELVCSGGGGVKLVQQQGDDGQAMAGHGLECALCLPYGAPPPQQPAYAIVSAVPASRLLPVVSDSHARNVSAAPLPARGPPLFV